MCCCSNRLDTRFSKELKRRKRKKHKTGTPFPHADNNVWARQQNAYTPPGPAPLILFFSRTVLGVELAQESDLKNQRSSRKETLWSTGIAKTENDSYGGRGGLYMWVRCVCVCDRPANGFKQRDGLQSGGVDNTV